MTLRVRVVLSDRDRQSLQRLVKRDVDGRVRERAFSLLLLAEGMTCQRVAERQDLSLQTVSATRRRWLDPGLAGWPDRPRCGAPIKLSLAERERLWQWAREEPLTLTALRARHEAAGGTPVQVKTLTGILKRAGFVWKRTRHRLKKTQ